jgi:ABC-type Na+ efflux pump permease subunit
VSRERIDWHVVRALMARDLRAVRRSKSVLLPMLLVPALLLVVLPIVLAFIATHARTNGVGRLLDSVPGDLVEPITALPPKEQLVVLICGFLLAPLFLIVPLMVSAVLAADAFAGEKERRTIEAVLHLPIRDRDLYVAKMLTAFVPAVAVAWVGFAVYAVAVNAVAWPVMHRVFMPTAMWFVMIGWVTPAVAAIGLGVMVRVSARAQTAQGANQLGGAVVLPLIFLALGQATGLLLVDLPVAFAVGGVIWLIALVLNQRGAQRFTRDRLAATV